MKITFGSKIVMLAGIIILLANFNVAKGAEFGTPYLNGDTTIAINQLNYPTKLQAVAANGGLISDIRSVNNPNPVAYYLVKGSILYTTGFKPGIMNFQVEETLSNGQKVLSAPITLTFYQINMRTEAACQGYDPTSRSLAVSPVNPLTLNVNVSPNSVRPALKVSLQNPALGNVTIGSDSSGHSMLQVVYKASGSTTLMVYDANNVAIQAFSLDFLPTKIVSLNLYHVIDARGNRSFKLDQQAMIGYMQTAEKILNQAGITLQINDQQNEIVSQDLGMAINANAEGQSAEEQDILNNAPVERNAATVSVFLVWDYQIQNENTIGINYVDDRLGQVIFLSEKSHKPGETLAHEIGHTLGLSHNVLSSDYLMSPAEVTTGDQCLVTRQERLTMNPI